MNRRGLIGQGLDVYLTLEDGRRLYLGLKPGDMPDENLREERIRYVARLLGAIAFEMFANPEEHRTEEKSKASPLEPNTAGVPEERLEGFRDAVEARLLAATLRVKSGSIYNEFALLERMNNGTVDFLFFRELDARGLAWHNRTVQAFFAAHWAMRYETPTEREHLKAWGVDANDELLSGFGEFWQFAAEMPDQLVDKDSWLKVFGPCYTPPEKLHDSDGKIQWCREMIYHSYRRMEKRSERTIKDWRSLWLTLEDGSGTPGQSGDLRQDRRRVSALSARPGPGQSAVHDGIAGFRRGSIY